MIIVLAVLAFLALSLFVGGIFATNVMYKPRHYTWEQGKQHDRNMGAWQEGLFEAQDAEPFTLAAADGVALNALWLWADRSEKKAVVLCHGFGCCAVNSFKYARAFMERGYNALIYDNRNAGESGGKRTTIGYLEREDLRRMVDEAFFRLGEDAVIGLHGESQGGASVIMEACRDERVAFVVADCPFVDLTEQLAHSLKQTAHLPRVPFLSTANLVNRLRAGFSFAEVSPLGDLEAAHGLPGLPMLFIHGSADAFIPPENSARLYAAKRDPKAIWICESAVHARSMAVDPVGYRRVLGEFLSENGL